MTSTQPQRGAFLVLGASGGIGSRTAQRLVKSGHGVLLAARGSDRLSELAEELQMPAREVDATNLEQVEACFAAVTEAFGHINGAVNCAGSVLLKPAHMTSAS